MIVFFKSSSAHKIFIIQDSPRQRWLLNFVSSFLYFSPEAGDEISTHPLNPTNSVHKLPDQPDNEAKQKTTHDANAVNVKLHVEFQVCL